MPYTVEYYNTLLGSTRFVGTFPSLESAEGHVAEQVKQTRKIVTYTIYPGTPRAPDTRKPARPPVTGAL